LIGIICVIWSAVAVNSHNKKVLGSIGQGK